MKDKFKRIGSKIAAGVTAVGTALGSSMVALAADGDTVDETVKNAINTAISNGATQIKGIISTNVPVIFGLAVLSVAVSIGLAWIHKLRKAS